MVDATPQKELNLSPGARTAAVSRLKSPIGICSMTALFYRHTGLSSSDRLRGNRVSAGRRRRESVARVAGWVDDAGVRDDYGYLEGSV